MSVTPDFIGQIYKDTNTGNLWRANSLAAGDWTLELQNSKLIWTPTNQDLTEKIGLDTTYANDSTINSITIKQSILSTCVWQYFYTVTSFSAPNLVSVDPNGDSGGAFVLADFHLVTSISLPVFVTCGGDEFSLSFLNVITSISLPSIVSSPYGFRCNNCPLLTTFSFPSFVPDNGLTLNFLNNALNAASVNHVLARCVANAGYLGGTIQLQGGTNSAPTGQGLLDKATLILRGVSVTTN